MAETEVKLLSNLVGKAIAKRRMASELTQEQVAERLGIGVEAVSRLERGVALPTVIRLGELADIFQCKIEDLVTEASPRVSDQAKHIEQLLLSLESDDRLMVLELVEKLTYRLSGKQKRT